jgi:hypothetical protein
MKRRITTDDLNELTPEQKERLKEWWKPEGGDFYYRDIPKCGTGDMLLTYDARANSILINPKEFKIPALDIGQMIEFLNEEWIEELYSVDYGHEMCKTYDGEICDALWEAVKTIL